MNYDYCKSSMTQSQAIKQAFLVKKEEKCKRLYNKVAARTINK